MFLVNFQSVNWQPTAVYNSFMSDNPVREDVEGKSRRRTETEVHLFFLIDLAYADCFCYSVPSQVKSSNFRFYSHSQTSMQCRNVTEPWAALFVMQQ